MNPELPARPPCAEPDAAELDAIRELYERGRCLQAHEAARRFGDLSKWSGTAARVMAGRLAMNLGAPGLGRRLHVRAYRRDPGCAEARYYFGLALLDLRGPLAVWEFLNRASGLEAAPPESRADLCTLRARAASLLRDFTTAEAWLAKAETLAPGKPWHCVERAFLLEMEDRYEEGLAAARQSLQLHRHPFYRPGVQTVAHFLQLLDRDGEALEFLREAAARLESGPVVYQLAALETELGRLKEAWRSLERYAELSPLSDRANNEALASQRCRVAYLLGDFPKAAEHARALDDPFFKEFAERLSQPGLVPRRVQLPVTFVRQYYKTCAPATLAAIGRFWKMPADHLALVEAICYDGTPAHSQRHWAEQHGWTVREFRLTWESAVALLDRGVPFTVTTVETANAHLQAVIGYDDVRRTLLLRDPFLPYLIEAAIGPFLERYRAHGPQAMALVPVGQAHLFDGIELPDAALYDRFHRLERALFVHDRPTATTMVEDMAVVAPDHPLTWQARRAVAGYDANPAEMLKCVDGLLAHFPKDSNLRLARLSSMHEARREERLEFLKNVCGEKDADPLFWQQYAWELSADAREHDNALRMLRRSLRRRPLDSGTFSTLADLLWHERRLAEATELYRFAACLEDKREQFSKAYFAASRHLKQTDAALGFLQDRFQRFGARSALPVCTLFDALCELEQTSQAFAILAQALQLRPSDGELLRFAAEAHGRWGRAAEAQKLLAAAQGKLPRTLWLRTASQLAMFEGDHQAALGLWRQVLEVEPPAIDAHRALAQLLAETEGRGAALQHLEQVCRRFPHNFALHQLWIEWLRDDGADAMEPAVRHLVAVHPSDAWARRELAYVLASQRRFPEAMAECDQAAQLQPHHPSTLCTRGKVGALAGNLPEAKAAYRDAIRLFVDTPFAIGGLMELCVSHAERKEALAFVESELIRQVVFGDGLLAFRDMAAPVLEPQELLASLRVAMKERPDLWHAHSALVQQLADMRRLDEALVCAREATERFPLLPRLWVDLARVHQARLDRAGEIEALEKALQLNPSWGFAARQLANACQRAGQLDRARSVLEQAVARAPLDPLNHGCLAEILWQLSQKPEALQRVQHALRLSPGYDWAWRAVREWAQQLDQPQLAVDLARDLTVRRGGEALSWLRLAETLTRPEDLDERLSALDKALALNPRAEYAYELRAIVLSGAQCYDEALAACRPAIFGETPPVILRARAAWIEFQRGQTLTAIEQMKLLLAHNPDYVQGWRELAEWCWKTGANADALEAAKKLSRLLPLDPIPIGYVADIKLRTGDRAGAKEDFRRALELDPNYGYAGFSLFDLQLEDGELGPAGKTLRTLGEQFSNEWLRAREAQLHARLGDRGRVMEILRELCKSTQPDPWPINAVNDAAVKQGWRRDVEEVYADAIHSPTPNPQVGCLWVEARTARRRWWCQRKLGELVGRGELGRRAMFSYVSALGNAVREARQRQDVTVPLSGRFHLWRLLRRHGDWLRRDTTGWSWTAQALAPVRGERSVIRWMSNWREHPQAEPWVLALLVMALRNHARDAEATEVCRQASSHSPNDGAAQELAVWLALEEALAGNKAKAAEQLAPLAKAEVAPFFQKLRTLAQVLVRMQDAAEPHRKFVLKEIQAELTREFPGRALPGANRAFRRAFARAMKRLAQDSGSAWPRRWGWRKLWVGL